MFHTPPHKQTQPCQTIREADKTLADYIQRRTDTPPKKTFEEYMAEMVLTKVGPRPREHALGEEKTAVAREAWIEARK